MCKVKGCNWFRHLMGICEHKHHADQLKKQIMEGKDEDIKALHEVSERVGIMLEVDAIDTRVDEISKISKGNGNG